MLSFLIMLAGLVVCIVFSIKYAAMTRKNFNTLNRINSKYAGGIDLDVASNDEFYEWIVSKNIEGLNVQKSVTPAGITINGYFFMIDDKKTLRAAFPRYEAHISKFARRKEDKIVPDKIEKSIEIDKILDKIAKVNNPNVFIDESFYTIDYPYRDKLQSNYKISMIAFAICWAGILGMALIGI